MLLNESVYLAKIWNDDYSNIDSVYMYAHQSCFLDDLFSIICLLKRDIHIYILDSPPNMSGCIGYIKIKDILINKYNITQKNIHPIPFLYLEEGLVNTLNESKSVIHFFENMDISKLLIASPVFHLPRAFLTILSVIFNSKSNIKVYCAPCKYIEDWDTTIYIHHQGNVKGTISELFKSEFDRIEKYQKKGDIVHIDKAIEYFKSRNLTDT